jgi:hypothetical protein
MLRRLGLTVAYFIAILYIASIVLPGIYCLQHGCKGPGEGDAFMPAFMFAPAGAIATVFSLRNCVQNIRRKSLLWLFVPLAVIFSIVLLGVAALIVILVYETAVHR